MKFALEGGGDFLLEDGTDFLLEEPWPDDGPGTNYYVSNAGNDAWAGTSTATAWATPNHALSALSAATGDITINFRSGDSFTGYLQKPTGVTHCLFQGLVHNLVTTTIGNASCVTLPADLPIITGGWAADDYMSIKGLSLPSIYTYGGIIQGSYTEVSYCRIDPGSGYPIYITGNFIHDIYVHHNTLGGTTPTSPGLEGIVASFLAYNILIEHNDIGFIGGDPSNPTQSGFGIHTQGVYDPINTWTPVAFTFSGGVPTNALITIQKNFIHDCGGNINYGGNGSTSGCELGNGDRQVFQDNAVWNQQPVTGWYGGYDMVGFDTDGNATNVIAQRNIFWNCFGPGMLSYDNGNTGPLDYRYNLIIDCGLGNEGNVDLQGNGNSGVQRFYGNTLVSTANNSGTGPQNLNYWEMQSSSGCVANNIIYTSSNELAAYAYYYPGLVTDHNCWYGSGFDWGRGSGSGTSYPMSYAAWSSMYHADANGITGDPLFVGTPGSLDPADYELGALSPCLGAGVDIYATYGLDAGDTKFSGAAVTSGAADLGCM